MPRSDLQTYKFVANKKAKGKTRPYSHCDPIHIGIENIAVIVILTSKIDQVVMLIGIIQLAYSLAQYLLANRFG